MENIIYILLYIWKKYFQNAKLLFFHALYLVKSYKINNYKINIIIIIIINILLLKINYRFFSRVNKINY